MAKYVNSGTRTKCSFGTTPGTIQVLPTRTLKLNGKPMANIMDNKPMVNIQSFGMCRSLANPTVASATAAAMGVLTPMPCIPNTTAPWMLANPTTLASGKPALTDDCKLMCMWGGMVEITG
jgi:hypothetical protein